MTGAAVVWFTAIVLAPVSARLTEPVAAGVYLVGSLICHQRPERSFHLAGSQLPVCARCTGLYLGAAIGLVTAMALARRRTSRWARRAAIAALAAAGAPTAVTVAAAWTGVLDPPNIWRAALAVPLGLAAGALVGAVTTDHLK